MKRMIRLVAVLALVVVGTACGGDDDDNTSATTNTPKAATTSVPKTTGPEAVIPVRVYFAWKEKVGTVGRTVDETAPARGAVEALLQGPDRFEHDIGMKTEIPSGTKLLGLNVANGVATVDLSSEFQSGGGSLSMQLRTADVVFTLTQFAEVRTVTITLGGNTVDGIGGEGIPAADLDRKDFENVTPAILVESPVPGQSVTSPLEVSGIANVFEAVVDYSINDPDGLVLKDGFTNASAGTGTWGDFAFTADYTTQRAGLGSVIVWETSMKDGSQRNVYEVPVRMG